MYFAQSEFDSRIQRVRAEMAERQLDLLILFGQETINWTSGFHTPAHFAYAAFGLPLEGEPFLIIRYLEEKAAQKTSWVRNYRTYWDHEDPVAATRDAVVERKLSGARIAVDKSSWYLTAERYERLCAMLPDATFLDEDHLIDGLRIKKSPAEVDYLRQASHIVEAGMRGAIAATRIGATERDIAAAMAYERLRAGSDLPVDGVLTTGERILEGHGPWTDRQVKLGDGLHYEFHGIKAHYWSRMLRSGTIGEPSARQRFVAETILRAQDAGLAKMRAGVVATEVDTAFREPMIEAGLKVRETYTNRMGYGLGLNFRPSPGEFFREFTPSSGFTLESGMVFHMIMAAEGLGFSDMVVVTDDGIDLLTDFPRELFLIEP